MDDYYRSCFHNVGGASSCHYEQYITAKQLMVEYTKGRRQVLLAAQMQSGKTGVYLCLAIMMVMSNAVNRVFIICGSNDVKLHAQLAGGVVDGEPTEGDIKTAINRYVAMLPAGEDKDAVAARLTLAIKAYKSSDLRSVRTESITSDTLVIWDESHFAQNSRNWPARFLRRCGLSVGGTERGDAKWAEKRSYFLSVSATPFAEFSAKHGREKERVTRSIVVHEPGDAYVGAMDFMEAGAIRLAFRVEGSEEEFTALLREHAAQSKYALIRSRNLDKVKACCRAAGVVYKNYYNGALELAGGDIKKALKDAPARFTVVGLKEMCRMGEVIPKEHIAFVFEEAKESKTDTLLQSLLGRMCGYSTSAEQKAAFLAQIKIYVPECFTTSTETGLFGISELDRYIRFTTEGIITPLKATCMGSKPKRSGLLILPPRWVRFAFEDEAEDPAPAHGVRAARGGAGAAAADVEDEDSDDSDYVDSGDEASDSDSEDEEDDRRPKITANLARRLAMCAAARAALGAQPYEDDRQQAEAGLNMTAGNCEFHDLSSKTYDYVRGVEGDKKSPGIYDHLQKNMRWEDHWNAKPFKMYMVKGGDVFNGHRYDHDGFYVVGYTEDGNADTKRECHNHIIPINSQCAFHPDADLADDEVVHAFPMYVVRNDRDADDFFAQPAGSQRFYYVSNTYAKTPRGRVIHGLLAAASAHAGKTKAGPRLTPKKKTELGIAPGEKFERFVMVPGINYSLAIHGNADGTTINIKINDRDGNQISDMNLAFPVGTPFSLNMSMHGRPTLSLTA